METIQDIKEKIPSDPFEAELILMAEMVAQQNEGNDKEKKQSEKESQAKDRPQDAAPPDGMCGEIWCPFKSSGSVLVQSLDQTFLIMKLQPKITLSLMSSKQ